MSDNISDTLDGAENEAADIFSVRRSVELTPENAVFFKSGGGLVSMRLLNGGGNEEYFERVVLIRAFPVTNPGEFICVREPDIPGGDKGAEIGMIRKLSDFGADVQALIEGELDKRYFSPVILKIIKIRNKMGYLYWDVETDAGPSSFLVRDPMTNVRTLEDGRVSVRDMNGNCYEIPDPRALGRAGYRKLEIYL